MGPATGGFAFDAPATVDVDAPPIELRMKPTSATGDGVVRLRDIADPVASGLSNDWESLGRTVVTLLPPGVDRVVVHRDRLSASLLGDARFRTGIRWQGSEQAAVSRTTDPPEPRTAVRQTSFITPETPAGTPLAVAGSVDPSHVRRWEAWFRSAVRTMSGDLAERYTLTLDPDGIPVSPPRGRLVGLIPPPGDPAGVQNWTMNLSDARGVRPLVIAVHARPHPTVPVMVRGVTAGRVIRPDDVALAAVPPDDLPSDHVTTIDDIVGREAATTLRADRAVGVSSLRSPRVIRRGDIVELTIHGGGVSVATEAVARADGSIGDVVEVETRSPRRRLTAEIVEAGVVRIASRTGHVR